MPVPVSKLARRNTRTACIKEPLAVIAAQKKGSEAGFDASRAALKGPDPLVILSPVNDD